ncbi:MAG: imidazole glycerol phosphate synthase subunit HisH [Bacteroidetes bacterium]|nr:MAG: imidazole glycerol phosphate synthase subunit HisH [Bacteroidota bacterium]
MIVIVDYGVGNLNSIRNMLKKAGVSAVISGDRKQVADASKLLLPGMGNFDNCMQKLNDSGLMETINEKVFNEKVPILGICVGLQMMMENSEEGQLPGLGWINGRTIRFKKELVEKGLKVPNMGWREIKVDKPSRLMTGMDSDSRFYFAHSYHVSPNDRTDILIEANYGYDFTAGIEHENIIGVQFHPEKSHRFGYNLLRNFAFQY